MDIRYFPDNISYERMTTEELRRAFLLDRMFNPGEIAMVYCDADRAIAGGAVPHATPLALEASRKEMAASYFTERREVGVVNLGADGIVRAGGADYAGSYQYYISEPRRINDLKGLGSFFLAAIALEEEGRH
jgi:4-deoxy-L-threo-5-hexosulose-uronate ketol-isomerase